MIVAEFSIIPVGAGSSMEEPLERVSRVLAESGIRHQVGPIGTVLEAASVQEILDVVRECHEAVAGEDVPRVVTRLTIDHRADKEETVESLGRIKG